MRIRTVIATLALLGFLGATVALAQDAPAPAPA